MTKLEEYNHLAQLEQETTRVRYATFTALISVSFVLPGLAVRAHGNGAADQLLALGLRPQHVTFLLGFVFYLFSVFHYRWYHRYSHRYRSALKRIEVELGVEIYRLRVRPQIGPMKMHFDWALYIIGVVYACVTVIVVGPKVFVGSIVAIVALYVALMVLSIVQSVEPLEE